jgi:hypothetical protein
MAPDMYKAWQRNRSLFRYLCKCKFLSIFLLVGSALLFTETTNGAAATRAAINIALAILCIILWGIEIYFVKFIEKVPRSGGRFSPTTAIRNCLALSGCQIAVLIAIIGITSGIEKQDRSFNTVIITACVIFLPCASGIALGVPFYMSLWRQHKNTSADLLYEPRADIAFRDYGHFEDELEGPLAREFNLQRQRPLSLEEAVIGASGEYITRKQIEHPWLQQQRAESKAKAHETEQARTAARESGVGRTVEETRVCYRH